MSANYFNNILTIPESIDPDKYIILTYRVRIHENQSLYDVASSIASHLSIGTVNPSIFGNIRHLKSCLGKVKDARQEGDIGLIDIALPLENFDPEADGFSTLLSTALYIFVYRVVKGIRLVNIQLPKSFIEKYKGPRFGIEGVRRLSKISERPLVGAIIKPRRGVSPKYCAEFCESVFSGLDGKGVDYIVDDELLISPPSCDFESRITRIMEIVDKINEQYCKRGERKLFLQI